MIPKSEGEAREWLASRSDLPPGALGRLARLETMLRAENVRQNLVSATSLDSLWLRHFADSVQLLDHVPRETAKGPWLDLGSGAGFPGLVVALFRPDVPIVLVESRAKRGAWLQRAAAEFGLGAITVESSRLEMLPSVAAGVISARAFAPLPRLIALSARFSTPQTRWVLPKGRRGPQELQAMPKAVRAMFHVEQSVTDADSVILVGRGVPAQRTKAS